MKYKFIIMMLSISATLFSQNNNTLLSYKVTLKENKINSNTTEGQKAYNKIIKSYKSKNYILKIKNNLSVFYQKQKLKLNEDDKLDLVSIFVGNGVFYFDSLTKEILNKKEFLGEEFFIKSTSDLIWNLTQESKKISNYVCYMAVTHKKVKNRIGEILNKRIVAWYTLQISLNFGIKDYQGLPGMIVQLEDEKLLYELSKIEINSKEKISIEFPKNNKTITIQKYDSIVKNKSRKF
jgi:GLPGLI family protein